MKCKNCKADNKLTSICDAGIACYVLRCGEYGCALNGKSVDKLLRMKKVATNYDRIISKTPEELAVFASDLGCHPSASLKTCRGVGHCSECWLDWLKQEAT